MINRRRSGARGTPAKVNATAGLEASEGVNSASVSDGSHESVHFCRIDQNQTEIDAFAQGADRAQDQDCSSRRKFRRPPDRFDAMPA
ncbi:hypothetical protein [Sphingomonas paucimobilis]|uniref:hypothetical protein n=1 Tax=Sphingomonas paucimobilis TaxID=13689 RepID=UPI003D8B5618